MKVVFEKSKSDLIKASWLGRMVLVFVVIALAVAEGFADELPKTYGVLVLNSYNATYDWTKEVTEGIQQKFDACPSRVELTIEYMDLKRIQTAAYLENFKNLLLHKSERLSYDIIITVDVGAAKFLMANRATLYPTTPIVFCGVGEATSAPWQEFGYITGVIEAYDYEPIIEVALKFHPQAKRVYVIKDAKNPYALNETSLAETKKRFASMIEFLTFKPLDNNTEDLLRIIGGLNEETIVLMSSSMTSEAGNIFDFYDHAEEIMNRCKAPIYVVKEDWFGIGHVVGGNIRSGVVQGKKAAELAISVLQGKKISEIPFVKKMPSQMMFDYSQLQYFHIPQSLLPKGSVVVNKPETFYFLYKKVIWIVISVIAFLTAMVIVLFVNALRIKRAEEALARRLRYEEALADCSRVLLTDIAEEEAFAQALRQLLKVSDVSRTYIFKNFQCPDGEVCASQIYEACADNVSPQINNKDLQFFSYIKNGFERWRQELSNGKPIVGIVSSFPPEERQLLQSQGILSVLVFPIIVKEQWYGFIGFDDTFKPRKWKEQDIILLQTGAETISSYLQRTQAAKALRESEERYRTLFHGAAEGIVVTDVETLRFKYVNPAFCKMLGYTEEEMGNLSVPDIHPKEELDHVIAGFKTHASGIDISSDKSLTPNIPCLKKDGTVIYVDIVTATETIDGRKCNIAFFTDITSRKQADEALRKAHDELEIRVQQRTMDLADTNKELRTEITERQKAETKLLTYHDQLRSMTSKLSLAEERVRRRMAIDIHDNVGQDLAISKMKIEALAADEEALNLKPELDEIRDLLAQTIKSTRSLTFELSPPVLYELGFEAAVNWLLRQATNQYGFSAKFIDDKANKPLEDDVRIILFQAVKEILFNVTKHAKAENVTILTKRVGDQITVEVVDDGCGFDVSQVLFKDHESGGFGLFSIRERLDYIGGRIKVVSKPNKGTHVTLFAPVKKPETESNGEMQK